MKFYTNTKTISQKHPYVLIHMRERKILLSTRFEHAIVDSGVMLFVDKAVTNYPESFLRTYDFHARQLTEIYGEKVWVVIPDYPDDYNPNQFGDNVEKTLVNVRRFLEVDGINWVVVLQSRYINRFSFLLSCEKTKKLIGDYPRVAIGTVCKCNNLAFTEYCSKTARKFFPKSHIHAFGLTLKALPRVKTLIDSFDSMAWTFPRMPGHSCKNKVEREAYFQQYLTRVNMILKEGEKNRK